MYEGSFKKGEGSLTVIKKVTFSALGAQQMLMHRKLCLILIYRKTGNFRVV